MAYPIEKAETKAVAPVNAESSSYSAIHERMAFDHWLRLLVILTTGLLLVGTLYVVIRLLGLIQHTVLLFALGVLLAYAFDPVVEWIRGNHPSPTSVAVPQNSETPEDTQHQEHLILNGDDSAPPPPETTETTIESAASQPVPAMPRARQKRPRWVGVAAVFGGLFLVIGLGTYLLGHELIAQAKTFSRDRDQIARNARDEMKKLDGFLTDRGIPFSVTDTVDNPPEKVRAWAEAVGKSAISTATNASRSAVEGLLVLIITAYFLLYSENLRHETDKLLPTHLLPYADQWRTDVSRVLGGFVRGQIILALFLGALGTVVCALLGLKLWLLIGVVVVFASLLPVVGGLLATIPALLSAVLSPAGHLPLHTPVARVIIVLLCFSFINEYGSKVLYPKLVGKALGLHEVLVLGVLLAGFEVGGIIGVIFAAPLTALAIVTTLQLWRLWHGQPPVSLSLAAEAASAEAERAGMP